MTKQRSNTKAIRLFAAHMAAKGTPVAKPVDVYRGAWTTLTEKPVAKTEEKK
jgi:hypothetical protein